MSPSVTQGEGGGLKSAEKVSLLFEWPLRFECTVKPVYNRHPWDSKKVAVAQKWVVFRGWTIKIEKLGITLPWLL
jgi:hypothetical protein